MMPCSKNIKREIEDIDYLNDIPGSKEPAAKATKEKNKEIKKSPLNDLKIRLVPVIVQNVSVLIISLKDVLQIIE